MALEVPLTQVLALYLGHCVFGFSVVLVALLLSSGVGSLLCEIVGSCVVMIVVVFLETRYALVLGAACYVLAAAVSYRPTEPTLATASDLPPPTSPSPTADVIPLPSAASSPRRCERSQRDSAGANKATNPRREFSARIGIVERRRRSIPRGSPSFSAICRCSGFFRSCRRGCASSRSARESKVHRQPDHRRPRRRSRHYDR
jgi:hypothetical protein